MISKSYTKIVWNLNSNKVTPTPLGVTSDTGRGIEVRIKVDEIFQTPENTLRLAAEKEDGTAIYLTADIVSGRYLFTKLAQVFSYSGKVTARLELQQGTDFISSENFVFEVPPSVAMSMIQSSSDFTALQKALTKTEAVAKGTELIAEQVKNTYNTIKEVQKTVTEQVTRELGIFTEDRVLQLIETGQVVDVVNQAVMDKLQELAVITPEERGILDRAFDLASDIVPRLEALDVPLLENLEQEVTAARGTEPTLGARLDSTDVQLADIKDKINNKSKSYGVQFSGSNAAGVRTHDAIGMVANAGVDDQLVQNDFDNVSFFQRPRCLVYHDSAGKAQVMAYEGEPGFNLEGAIFAPYTEKAQVFYEQKPFYWNGDLDWPQVSATPLEGFELAPMFKNPVDKVYLPSYWLGLGNGKACSLSGTHPEYNSINGSMATARLYHARAHLETMVVRISEYVLQLVEFATRDAQTVMTGAMSNRYSGDDISILAEDGANRIVMANTSADQFVVGQTICIGTTKNGSNIATRAVITAIDVYDASSKAISFDGPPLNIPLGAFISTRAWRNGATDIVKASSGSPVSNSNGRYPCIWRGKVDPWAMAYSGISDVLIQRSGAGTVEDPYTYNAYQLEDPTLYNNGIIDENWKKVDYNLSSSDGYVTQMGRDPKSPAVRMPTAVGGASTTYYASYYYYGRYAVGAVFVGGGWTDGRRCSPVCFGLLVAPSASPVNRLARLFVSPS